MSAGLVGLGVWFIAWMWARRDERHQYRRCMSTLQRLLEGNVNEVLTEDSKEAILDLVSGEWPAHVNPRRY